MRGVLHRRRWTLVLCTLATALISVAASVGAPVYYRSEIQLSVVDPDIERAILGLPGVRDPTRAAVETAADLDRMQTADRVAERLQGKDFIFPLTVQQRTRVSVDTENNFIKVTADMRDPQAATNLANQYAQAYIDIRRRRDRIDNLRAAAEARRQIKKVGTPAGRASLRDRILQLEASAAVRPSAISIVSPASKPNRAIPPIWLTALLGLLFGFPLAVGIAALRDVSDRRARSPRSVADRLGARLLTLPGDREGGDARGTLALAQLGAGDEPRTIAVAGVGDEHASREACHQLSKAATRWTGRPGAITVLDAGDLTASPDGRRVARGADEVLLVATGTAHVRDLRRLRMLLDDEGIGRRAVAGRGLWA